MQGDRCGDNSCELLGRGLVTGSPGHMGDDGGEVGGAVELHSAQALVVGLQDAVDAAARGVVLVAVLGAEDGG